MVSGGHYGADDITTRQDQLSAKWTQLKVMIANLQQLPLLTLPPISPPKGTVRGSQGSTGGIAAGSAVLQRCSGGRVMDERERAISQQWRLWQR